MKIYTRSGDKGKTSLVGGSRISKAALRIEAYGTLDELCSALGYLACGFNIKESIREELEEIVSRVMDASAIVASEDTTLEKLPALSQEHIKMVESWIDNHLEGLPALKFFTLPIGDPAMSYAHVCRTVARRAERAMVRTVDSGEYIPEDTMCYINRLSDYLYALSRRLAFDSGAEDVLWKSNSKK
ncbi:MAG: cob(I)yrinic acid a,c-diamide adenosyltransferase [Rikenellaceae bacterium]